MKKPYNDLLSQIKAGKISQAKESFNALMERKKKKVLAREYKNYVADVFKDAK